MGHGRLDRRRPLARVRGARGARARRRCSSRALPSVRGGCRSSAAALLVGFALWTALSAAWSPVPSLARDDGLLALFYAVCLLTPLVTLRSAAIAWPPPSSSSSGLGAFAVWTAVWLREAGDPELLYYAGRLDFPVTYWNGQAAMALVAFWPAVALAARQDVHAAIRALALGGATAMACLWLGTQSKGGGVALAVSAIVVFAVSGRRLRLLVPTAVVAVLGAFAAEPLTEPFRTDGQAFDDAVRHAGTVTLVLAGHRRARGSRRMPSSTGGFAFRTRRGCGPGASFSASCAWRCWRALSGFFAAVDHPVRATQDRWDEFRKLDHDASASTHFGALGSNRYDFWRRRLGRVRASSARRHRRLRLG